MSVQEAERQRLQEQLAAAQSDAAAATAAMRDRLDGALGEASGLKAELHGAALEKAAVADEASRLRRRCEAAEERVQGVSAELHALRLEHSEVGAAATTSRDLPRPPTTSHDVL